MVAVSEQRTVEYARERLGEWARWVRSLSGVRLGYSNHASFVVERVDDGGYVGPMDSAVNERAEEVERAMCKLNRLRPSLHRVIMEFYLREQPQETVARILFFNLLGWNSH